MNKYSVCIIDDKIPVSKFPDYMDETKVLNQNNFQHLLFEKKSWDEIQLLNLVENLFRQSDYTISGFSSHNFFLNHIEENTFSPDVVIFDWDVGEGTSANPKGNLLRILKTKHCLIAIYTAADQTNEVTNIIDGDEFKVYKDRLFLIKKDNDNSVDLLTQAINERLDNFSFNLGKTIKRNTLQAIDNILIGIGKLSFNQFISLFGTTGPNNKKILTQNDFIDILNEKLKYELNNISLESSWEGENTKVEDVNLLRGLWRFRLYHYTKDEIIRKGDILQKGADEDKLFLVLSSDCHLDSFWYKTLGHLALVPLYKIDKDNLALKGKINYRPNNKIARYEVTSLVNPNGFDFLTILPSLVVKNKEHFDYALIARERFSLDIKLEGTNANNRLLVSDTDNYHKLVSISEPFISALHQFITNNYTGIGLPDFSSELQTSIKENLQGLKK